MNHYYPDGYFHVIKRAGVESLLFRIDKNYAYLPWNIHHINIISMVYGNITLIIPLLSANMTGMWKYFPPIRVLYIKENCNA